jgi:hypothetical protein
MKTITNTIAQNLVPPSNGDKTEKKVEANKVNLRDNYGLAAAFFPFVGVIIWIGLVLINNLIIEQSRLTWESNISRKKVQIEQTYGSTLITHGELVVKTNQLAGLIEKDIQPEEVFILVEKLFPDDTDFNVIGFGRESDGSFSVSVEADTYIKFSKIVRRFSNYEKVKNVQVKNVTLNKTNLVSGTINFSFISAELNSATTKSTVTPTTK